MNKSEQLIACLEGEVAKRDETIARLEPQLNRAIQANYDLREELAACRVAVENCEVFRARIAELEEKLAVYDDANFNLRGLLQRGAFALGLDPENTSWFEVIGDLEKQGSGFAAIKAQEPVARAGTIEGGVPLLMVEPQNWKATPLYAAPVSEAKAQGVVQWPDADEIMQMAFEEGQPADDASGYCFELEEFDLFIDRLMSEVARLNTAPVQRVSVPDGWKLVPVEPTHEMLGAALMNQVECLDAIAVIRADYKAMLAAAPAAPAADAGMVLEQAMYALIGIGYHENSGLVHELRQSLAAHRANWVV